ncbi:MAG: hypothetical protein EOS63_30005, partial [Mesorhizobium sp.]
KSQNTKTKWLKLRNQDTSWPECDSREVPLQAGSVRSQPSKKEPHCVERHGLYKCGACRSPPGNSFPRREFLELGGRASRFEGCHRDAPDRRHQKAC